MPETPDPARIATPRDFGAELTLARERGGLTVRQLARKAEVPRGTVQDYLTGGHLPQPTNLDPLKRILAACGEDAAERVEEWIKALARARRAPGRRSVADPQPYRGLSSFGREDAAWFHGREELTARVTGRALELIAEGGGLLIVVGPSGAGKSSLLRAGVMPSLHRHGLGPVLLTPGVEPLAELDAAVAHADDARPRIVVIDQFEEVFADEVPDADRQEFVTRLCGPATATEGVSALLPADPFAGLTAVLGMRADFYAHALRHPRLAEAMQRDQIVVGPMNTAELRRVIVEPARQAHLDVEDGLVEMALRDLAPRLIGTAAHDAGALPLLSHTLRAVWERHRGAKLTLADYLAVGGIAGSIAKSADAAFAELSEQRRDLARSLFGRLVRTGEDSSPDTRRRVPLTEILGGHSEARADDVQEVLDCFIRARLLTVGDDTIEITHEALLTVWPQLTAWIEADRDWLRRHRALGAAADQWRDSGRDPDLLYRGAALQALRQSVEEGDRLAGLNAAERGFFEESVRRETDREVRERRRTRRRYRFVALMAILAVIAGSAAVYARQQRITLQREQTQSLSRLVADEADALRGNDVSLSMQLALAAYQISPTPEALSSLLDATGVTAPTRFWPPSGQDAAVVAVDGQTIAVGTSAAAVQLMTAAPDGRILPIGKPLAGGTGEIQAIRFGRSGTLLAAGGVDGHVYLWDTGDPSRPRSLGSLTTSDGPVTAIAVTADGKEVAAGTSAGTVGLWKASGPAHFDFAAKLTGFTGPVNGAAFTSDGRTLVAGGNDGTARLWGVSDPFHPAALSTVTTPNSRIFTVDVSPDGRMLAAGTAAGHDVVLWNIADPAHPAPSGTLTGPGSWVNAVAFDPHGRTIAAASSDGQLWIYDLASRQELVELPHPKPVTGVAFLGDGSPVTVTVDDGVARRWNLPGPVIAGAKDQIFAISFDRGGKLLGVSPGASDDTLTLWNTADTHRPVRLGPPLPGGTAGRRYSGSGALTPDGDLFVAGDVDGTVQLWDVSDPQHPARLGPPVRAASALIEAVTVSPRGDLLATAADDGTVHLFRITAQHGLTSLATMSTPSPKPVYQVVFDPDERLLVAPSEDHFAYIYDIGRPAKPVLRAHVGGFTSAAYSAAFNRTGRMLAVGSADSSVRLWNMTAPGDPVPIGRTLVGSSGYIYSLAFSPLRDTLVTAGNEGGGIWVWDLTDPAQPTHSATLAGSPSGVVSVAFNPGGGVLAAGGVNHTVQLWDMAPPAAATWICTVAGTPITRLEWSQYIPNRAYDPPCSDSVANR